MFMPRRLVALAALVALFSLVSRPCLAAEDGELSNELRVLDQRVGTWKTETTIKPGVWVPEGGKTAGVETIEWTLGKKFIKGEAKSDGPRGKGTNMHLMTYDAHEGVYRFWYFDSQGDFPRADMKGTFDENLNTITFKSVLPNDIAVVVSMRFESKDRVTWRGEWKDKEGKVMMEIDGVVTRIAAKDAK